MVCKPPGCPGMLGLFAHLVADRIILKTPSSSSLTKQLVCKFQLDLALMVSRAHASILLLDRTQPDAPWRLRR